MPVAELLQRHPDAWRDATAHPFLDVVTAEAACWQTAVAA